MFAAPTMHAPRRHAHRTAALSRETRPATYEELERAIGGLTAEHLGGADVALLSLARADDGAYAVIECMAEPAVEPARLERAAQAVVSGLSTAMVGVTPGAELRVMFAESAGF